MVHSKSVEHGILLSGGGVEGIVPDSGTQHFTPELAKIPDGVAGQAEPFPPGVDPGRLGEVAGHPEDVRERQAFLGEEVGGTPLGQLKDGPDSRETTFERLREGVARVGPPGPLGQEFEGMPEEEGRPTGGAGRGQIGHRASFRRGLLFPLIPLMRDSAGISKTSTDFWVFV
jgi:hypothetical protein